MAETLRKVVSYVALPLHVGSFYLSLVNATFEPHLAPAYAAAALTCAYILLDMFVLPRLPAFKNSDQLSGGEDTDGIHYDEVETKKH